MIPIARPEIRDAEISRVVEVLKSGNIAQGYVVREFEDAFAKYMGVKHAIACSNGTAALHVALRMNGIGPDSEVIVPAFSFIATATAVSMCGATPVFADVHPLTYGIDVYDVRRKITDKTHGIIGVHLYGLPCDIASLVNIRKEYEDNQTITIIEDSAQAIGSMVGIEKCGSIGDAGCFSFYATKNLTTGEGGMITTNSDIDAEYARSLINHGQTEKYVHSHLGYNYRMTDIQGAIGVEKLKYISESNRARRYIASIYNKEIESDGTLLLPCEPDGLYHTYHQYVLQVSSNYTMSRDNLARHLHDRGVGTAIHYPTPIHKQAVYNDYVQNSEEQLWYACKCRSGSLPISEGLSGRVLSIPVHPALSVDQVIQVVDTINEVSKQ
jgi:perosamine synthetase